MIETSHPSRSRFLSVLPFIFAGLFFLFGIALILNNTLYATNKIFLSWLLINFESDNQWFDPLLFWLIAGAFLMLGLFLHRRRRRATSVDTELGSSETTEKSSKRTLKIPAWLVVIGIVIYVLFTGYIGLLSLGSQVFNADGTVYEDRLSYQGNVYLLSVAPKPEFTFEVSQCDASGWFCHVIYNASRKVSLKLNPDVNMPFMYAEVVEAHLQADATPQQLLITYQGEGSSETGKLFCPIP